MTLGMRINEAKAKFFDRRPVMSAMDRATLRVFSRFGAYVRTRAITLMLGHKVPRKFGVKSHITNRSGISLPGNPPSPHTGDIVRMVLYAYNAADRSLVIGPAKINKPSGRALEVLEYGGDAPVTRFGKTLLGHYRARPFMRPALAAELATGSLDNLWRKSVRV